ncbi:fatty acid-binding protein, adipocyte-like [Alosa sapidissima]|nr:fatty acid-binding protein, adipocyte-like [Alosa sapidissima]
MSQAVIGCLAAQLSKSYHTPRLHLNVDFQTHHPRDQTRPDAAAIMAEKFVGTWKIVESENFDEYLKELGVGFALRQIASRAKPSQIVTLDTDGTITMKTLTTFKNTEIKFKLNEEFEQITGDDRKTKNVVTLDNGVMIQKQTWDDKETTIERELVGDKFIVRCKAGDVVSVRTYARA